MQKIAITGVIGSGKSTVMDLLHKRGFRVVLADNLARLAIMPYTNAWHSLVQLLGKQYLKPDASFDRKRIADLVFYNSEILKKVEDILHPVILDLLKKELDKAAHKRIKVIFFEVPLLFEKNLGSYFDMNLLIAVDLEKQKERLQKRGLSVENILSRMQFQTPQAEKIKVADYVIWNNHSLQCLKQALDKFIKKIKIDSM